MTTTLEVSFFTRTLLNISNVNSLEMYHYLLRLLYLAVGDFLSELHVEIRYANSVIMF